MTKNEYIASIMLEAAELLKEDVSYNTLNEGIGKDAKLARKLSEDIKNSMNFTESEKDKGIRWLDDNGDKIERLAKLAKRNLNKAETSSKRWSIAILVTMPIVIIPFILSIIWMIVESSSESNMDKTHINLKTIKRKLNQIDKHKLSNIQLKQYEKIMDAINEYEDSTTIDIKTENQ